MNNIVKGWSKETAHPSYQSKWTHENPSAGQCAITAMYLNQKYGYPIFETMVGKSRHFFNKDKEGNIVDLTKDQFDDDISYTRARERQFKDLYKSCKSRYDKFISNLGETPLKEAKKGYLDDEGKFFDFRTREVEGNNFIDDHKTGVPYYDDFLKPDRAEELEKYENLKGEIVMMSPREYYQECADNIFDKKPSVDALIKQRGEYDRNIIEHLKEVLLKYKKRFPMPYLNYTGSKGQEGLHRMLCLAEITSWDTKFPVLVITYADQERADRARKEKEIAKLRIKISSAVQDALRYKYANIDEFKEQLQYSLDREWEWMDLPSPSFTLEDDGEYYTVRVGEAEEDFLKSSIKIEEMPELEIDEDDLDIDDFDLEETEDFLKRHFGDNWRETDPHLKDIFNINEELTTKTVRRDNPNDFSPFGYKVDFYDGDKHIGEGSVCGIKDDNAFLYDFEVYPEYRGKGYSKEMLQHMIDQYDLKQLYVDQDNTIAINLYKKYGFKIDDEVDDNGKPAYSMLREDISNTSLMDIQNILDEFDYAFIDKDGNELDDEDAMDAYVQSPEQFSKLGKGVCTDYVEYTKKFLEDKGIDYTTYDISFTDEDGDEPSHVCIVAHIDGKYVWIENSWHSEKGNHEYSNLNDFFEDIAKKHCVWDGNDYLDSCVIREFDKSLVGMTQQQVYDYMHTIKPIWVYGEED